MDRAGLTNEVNGFPQIHRTSGWIPSGALMHESNRLAMQRSVWR